MFDIALNELCLSERCPTSGAKTSHRPTSTSFHLPRHTSFTVTCPTSHAIRFIFSLSPAPALTFRLASLASLSTLACALLASLCPSFFFSPWLLSLPILSSGSRLLRCPSLASSRTFTPCCIPSSTSVHAAILVYALAATSLFSMEPNHLRRRRS
ncbi:hypothetical protein DFH94DRAFT_345071 [Russula ochroleuca]|jgi:hypothetical protein|uniref:Uncharacterized protein n=1 Tax=Russula ochroleuca TaxID=152965 RepID=A0A9P5JVE3_9AGAM|nr:hypothetical protein DFH94DRAFT_345071 [Russula ochroleuca]